MGLAQHIHRIVNSVIPVSQRSSGGVYYTFLPTGAGLLGAKPVTLTAHTGTAYKYGAVATVISATANTTECWIEGVVLSAPNAAKLNWMIAVTTATAITAASQIAAELPAYLAATAEQLPLILPAPVYIPANKAIGLAAGSSSAGKTVNAYVIISRNR